MADNADFKHEPLDHEKDSIRLIGILPELSEDGQIQLSLEHYTIHDRKYSCLSYMWGDSCKAYTILINGKLYRVQQNLWGFLDFARKHIVEHGGLHLPSGRRSDGWTISRPLFWIDAISIDQIDTVEKNHQVQQMSEVYRSAILVLVWLNGDPESYIECGSRTRKAQAWLSEHEYWSRAWITQEVALARKCFVPAKSALYHLTSVVRINSQYPPWRHEPGERESPFKLMSRFVLEGFQNSVRETNLFHNLQTFGTTKQCRNILDRIYSLLGLASNNTLVVNYGIQPVDLLRQVIRSSRGQICFCEISLVAKALEVRSATQDTEIGFATKVELRTSTCVRPGMEIEHKCYKCADVLPTDFHQLNGLYFCLAEVCESMHGHIFAHSRHEETPAQAEDLDQRPTKKGLFALGSLRVCEITGIELAPGRAPVKYPTVTWRFSLDALVQLAVIQNQEQEQGVVQLCRKALYTIDIGDLARVGKMRACS